MRLGAVIDELGHPRVLALTATAPERVRNEIVERLHMRSPHVVLGDMDRPNIRLAVRWSRNAAAKLRELVSEVQAAFMSGGLDVIAATSAFGMGVDKPDVRFVFHYDVSASLEAYYQEHGRAGRDGKPARALLFYRPQDLSLLENQKDHHAELMRSLERMRIYAELRHCRRRYLLDYFGQEIDPCGRCDNCEAGLPSSPSASDERPFPLKTRVVHSKLGKGVVLDYSGSHVTVLFDEAGEKAFDVNFALERGLLARA